VKEHTTGYRAECLRLALDVVRAIEDKRDSDARVMTAQLQEKLHLLRVWEARS
jgi:hypothetical protein